MFKWFARSCESVVKTSGQAFVPAHLSHPSTLMPKLTPEDVKHIAELTRLALTPEEIAQYASDLSAILDYAQQLQEVPTDHIHPTASVLPLRNVMRPDEVQPGLDPEDALANAPQREHGYFKVPAVLEGGQ